MLLSIAIPSHNKTNLLREAVTSILSEDETSERWGIFISDNSAGTDTSSYFESELKTNSRITYRRSLDAPSLDENVHMAVSKSDSEYVWIFGDDDLIVPGILVEILGFLESNSPDIVIVNSESFQSTGPIEPARMPIDVIRSYGPDDNDSFLADFGGYLTYVPCIVVRKSLWESHYPVDKVGTFFCHLETILRIKRGRTAYYLPKPTIKMRLHFQTWVAKHFEIWNVFYPNTIWSIDGYSDEAKRQVIPENPICSVTRILAGRAYGRFNYSIWKEIVRYQDSVSFTRKLIYCLIALIPRNIFRLLYIAYIRTKRTQQTIGFSPRLALAQLSRDCK